MLPSDTPYLQSLGRGVETQRNPEPSEAQPSLRDVACSRSYEAGIFTILVAVPQGCNMHARFTAKLAEQRGKHKLQTSHLHA